MHELAHWNMNILTITCVYDCVKSIELSSPRVIQSNMSRTATVEAEGIEEEEAERSEIHYDEIEKLQEMGQS
jgi:hypothetical protein